MENLRVAAITCVRFQRNSGRRDLITAADWSLLRAMLDPMNCAALFAGIGGIEVGLERAGHATSFFCELDPGACAVLSARFPGVPLHHDVATLKSLPKGTELLTAGFPCQDLSQAGATAGISGMRSGLVSEVFRLLRKQRVPWLLLV